MRSKRRPTSRFALWRSDEGIAAVEFALLAPVVSVILMLVVDFGFAFNTQLRLISAAAAGAQYIQKNGAALTSSNFSAFATSVTSVVTTVSGLSPAPTVVVKINNTTDGSGAGKYYCASGSPPSWTQVSSASASCSTDLYGGQFVTLTVSTTLTNIFPTDPVVSSVFPLQETVIVRVQ